MLKKKVELVSTCIISGTLLLIGLFSFVESDSSQAEFQTLSYERMASLTGGGTVGIRTVGKRQGSRTEGHLDFANCSNDSPPCDGTIHHSTPTIVQCLNCSPPYNEANVDSIVSYIDTWCAYVFPFKCELRSTNGPVVEHCYPLLTIPCRTSI